MSEQIILRQKGSGSKVIQNGNFRVNLASPVTLNTGDQIVLEHCSIDTVQETEERIVLDDDLLVSIENGFYIKDWDTTDKTYSASSDQPNGKNYILMAETGLETINTVVFEYNNIVPGGNIIWGNDYRCYFNYIDTSGNQQEISYVIPKHRTGYTLTETFTVNINVRTGSFQLSPKSTPAQLGNIAFADIQSINTTPVAGTTRWDPFLASSGFIVPKGSYSPQEFGEVLTKLFSINKGNTHAKFTDTDIGLESPFLYLSDELDNTTTVRGPTFWREDNVEKTAYYTAGSHKLIGTSQVALEYNQNTGKFQWTAVHMPPYDDEGNISVGYYRDGATPSKFFLYDKNSGIFFTKFSSVYNNTGKSFDIFEDILGFKRSINLVELTENKTYPGGAFDYTFIKTQLTTGKNITGEFPGIDAYVNKNSATTYNVKNPANNTLSTSSGTLAIEADIPFEDTEKDSAYFQLEFYNTFTTNTISSDTINHNIFALVSKYYSFRTFTFAQGNSGFGYIHNSAEPIQLQWIEVLIRDPNTDQVASIGDDNTAVLKIIRSNTQERLALKNYLEDSRNKEKKE